MTLTFKIFFFFFFFFKKVGVKPKQGRAYKAAHNYMDFRTLKMRQTMIIMVMFALFSCTNGYGFANAGPTRLSQISPARGT